MTQRPFQPTPQDVERKLAAMFPNERLRDVARSALFLYGRELRHSEVGRVRLAILKLAGPDITAIDKKVDAANIDYRDVLAAAEYPAYALLEPGIDPTTPEAQRAIESDRRQYLEWLDS